MNHKQIRNTLYASIALWVILLITISVASAALYNIISTDEFVNGVPSGLTVKERAKLITATVAKTEQSCLAGKCELVDKLKAKAKIKAIIASETCVPPQTGTWPNCVTPPPPTCPSGTTGTPPNCVPIPPPTSVITYPDGKPSIDTSKLSPPSVGYSNLRIKATSEIPASSPDDKGAVRVVCGFSHMNFDDAIVFPNQEGASHLHTYFGNTGANYASTSESIRTTGNSTCAGGIMNRSAYWIPAMIDRATNAPLRPSQVQVYYKHSTVQVIPRGLRMVSGSAKRTTSVNNSWERTAYYECNNVYSNKQDNIIPCGKGGVSTMVVSFMQCWDGVNLDSPNHQDHMKFASNGTCPATHHKKLPTITIKAYYPIDTDAGTANWSLASDAYAKNGYNGGFSAHADFIMGWDEPLHKVLVDNCINKQLDCHSHLTGDGRMFE